MMARRARHLLAVALVSGAGLGACLFRPRAEPPPTELPSVPSPPADVSGTWTGTLSSSGVTAIGIRFVLEETQGVLKGQLLFEDPVSKAYVDAGTVNGTRMKGSASWEVDPSELRVSGTFEQNGFIGKLTFPAVDDEPSYQTDLVLNR